MDSVVNQQAVCHYPSYFPNALLEAVLIMVPLLFALGVVSNNHMSGKLTFEYLLRILNQITELQSLHAVWDLFSFPNSHG